MTDRKFNDRQRARQLTSFSNLQWGRISPTDVDGLLEVGDEAFFFIEAKCRGAAFPTGQRLAMERVVKGLDEAHRNAVAILARHDTKPSDDIDLGNCLVERVYHLGRWVLDGERTVREVIDAYLWAWPIGLGETA